MKNILKALAVVVFISCNIKETELASKVRSNPKNLNSINSETPFLNPDKFKVKRQASFSLNGWGYNEIEEKLQKLSDKEVAMYFQEPRSKENAYHIFHFFSIQENTPKRKSITILESDESCCSLLYLLTYDEQNKLRSKHQVAGSGGDGGWGFDAYGRFESDSIYKYTRVDEETIRDDQDTVESKVDSVIAKYIVDKNMNFKKKTENKFEYKKLRIITE